MAIPFTKEKLLVVEGKDEINFFRVLFEHMGISDSIDIRDAGGKDRFKTVLPTFTIASGFKSIKKIGIVMDADEHAENTFRSVSGTIEKIGLTPPEKPGNFSKNIPSVGIFIMPDNNSNGMLEDLCLSSVRDQKAMKCVEDFIICSQELQEKPKNIAKAKVQAFLAIKPTIVNSIGLGAQKGYWDLESDNLLPLISFLKKF